MAVRDRRRLAAFGCLLVACALSAVTSGHAQPADDPQPAQALTERDLERLVDQLGADELARREDAYRQLIDAGEAAIAHLEAGVRRRDPEIRWRAQRALELCRWGITSQLREIEEQLNPFLSSPVNRREVMLRQWSSAHGPALLPFLRQVALRDVDRRVRQAAFEGVVRVTQNDERSVRELAERITRNDAGAGWAWIALARSYRQAARLDLAIDSLQQVLRMDPTNYDATDLLAQIHRERGDMPAAARFHRQARDSGRSDADRLHHAQALADLHLELGNVDQAKEALEWMLERGNRSPATILTLVAFYFGHDMAEDAEALGNEVVEEWRARDQDAPNRMRLLDLLIVNALERGSYDRVAAHLGEWLELAGDARRRMVADRTALIVPTLKHAWAQRIGGERDLASETIAAIGNQLAPNDVAALAPALRLAQSWRDWQAFDALSERAIELSPRNGHVALGRHALDTARDRETARTHARQARADLLRNANGSPAADWMMLLSLWDAIGDDREVMQVFDQIVGEPTFFTDFPREIRQHPMARAVTGLRALEMWAANAEPRRRVHLISAYMHAGEPAQALAVARDLSDDDDVALQAAIVMDAMGDRQAAIEWLEDRIERTPTAAFIGMAAQLYFESGRFEDALELLGDPPIDLRQTPTEALRIDMLFRLGRYDAVANEVAPVVAERTDDFPESLWLRIKWAEAEFARGRFAEAADVAEQVLHDAKRWRADGNPEVVVREEIWRAGRLLADVGRGSVVLGLYAPGDGGVLRPRDAIKMPFEFDRFNRLRPTLHRQYDAFGLYADVQKVMACAYALEASGRPREALGAYLQAWRECFLDGHAAFVKRRIAELATPDRLAALCETWEDELAPLVGSSLREGPPSRIRHSRTTHLRMLAHARALRGDVAGAAGVLRFLVDHAVRNDWPAFERVGDEPDRSRRDYNRSRTVDIGVELVQLLVHPERVAGVSADVARALATRPSRAEEAREALTWLARLQAIAPHDGRVLALYPLAAAAAGEEEHEAAQAAAARLAAHDALDQWNVYAAAFHFHMHRWDDVAESLWRHVLANPGANVHVTSNAYEYLGRLLDRQPDPARRAEAIPLWREEYARIALEGWMIDEDGHEGLTYLAREMRTRALAAIADENERDALTYARRAVAYAPHEPEYRLLAARLLAGDGRYAEATDVLRPPYLATVLRLRTAPDDAAAATRLRELQRVPGVVFDEVPPTDAVEPADE